MKIIIFLSSLLVLVSLHCFAGIKEDAIAINTRLRAIEDHYTNKIRRQLLTHIKTFENCRTHNLGEDQNNWNGRINLIIKINNEGKVIKSNVVSEHISKKISDCINEKVQAIQFPPTEDGKDVVIVQPMFFKISDKNHQ